MADQNDPSRLFAGAMLRGTIGEARFRAEAATPAVDPERYRTLAEAQAAGIVLFTHGPLFTYGGLTADRDPVREFVEGCAAPVAIAAHDFAGPLFRGVARSADDEPWDRRLLFAPWEHWKGLLAALAGAATIDRAGGRFHRAWPQLTWVVDRLAVDRGLAPRGAPAPRVPVTAFGVTGTAHRIRFDPAPPSRSGVAVARRLPLDPLIQAEARRALGGHEDPFGIAP